MITTEKISMVENAIIDGSWNITEVMKRTGLDYNTVKKAIKKSKKCIVY